MTSLPKPPRFPQSATHRDGFLGLGPVDLAGAALSLLWVVVILIYSLTAGDGADHPGPGFLMTVLLILVPVAAIWGGIFTLHAIHNLQQEARRLRQTVDEMRSDLQQSGATGARLPLGGTGEPIAMPQELRLEPRVTARDTAPPAAKFSTRRDPALSVPSADQRSTMAPPSPAPEAEQPRLALGTPETEAPPISPTDFIAALQFPESAEDQAGFRALRRALADRESAKLIRAAQDVLTLLSQEGIFMDDLPPELCHPDLWRRFATGERGPMVAAVGGIHDRASLALTSGRMREDMIFRDAAHHFLRTFDRLFQSFEKSATDTEILALADSRTARAFMLVGRVSGVFD